MRPSQQIISAGGIVGALSRDGRTEAAECGSRKSGSLACCREVAAGHEGHLQVVVAFFLSLSHGTPSAACRVSAAAAAAVHRSNSRCRLSGRVEPGAHSGASQGHARDDAGSAPRLECLRPGVWWTARLLVVDASSSMHLRCSVPTGSGGSVPRLGLRISCKKSL